MHLVAVYIIYVNDARSNKYQIHETPFTGSRVLPAYRRTSQFLTGAYQEHERAKNKSTKYKRTWGEVYLERMKSFATMYMLQQKKKTVSSYTFNKVTFSEHEVN